MTSRQLWIMRTVLGVALIFIGFFTGASWAVTGLIAGLYLVGSLLVEKWENRNKEERE